jgi:hypothetical protein
VTQNGEDTVCNIERTTILEEAAWLPHFSERPVSYPFLSTIVVIANNHGRWRALAVSTFVVESS